MEFPWIVDAVADIFRPPLEKVKHLNIAKSAVS
jgi:hypothetical protein